MGRGHKSARRASSAGPGRDDPIAVRPRTSREARIEVLGRLHGLDDGNVLRQRRVQRLQHPLPRWTSLDSNARHLTRRVHTGVGAPGHREPLPPREQHVERVSEHSFDRAQAGLPRPAAKARAVVLERQLEVHDVTSWRARVDRPVGTDSYGIASASLAELTVRPGSGPPPMT